MALIKCKQCSHMISDKALSCPKCGWSTTKECIETSILSNENVHKNEHSKNSRTYDNSNHMKSIFKYYVPIVFILCCIVTLIVLHYNYRYSYWWVDEEYVIGGAFSIFVLILLIYTLIIKAKLH